MEADITDSLIVILHDLVWLRAHVHIKPDDLLVIGSEDEVISFGVHSDAGNKLRARLVLGHDSLFLQVVLEDGLGGASEEVGFQRVESHGLDDTLGLGEWTLGGGS